MKGSARQQLIGWGCWQGQQLVLSESFDLTLDGFMQQLWDDCKFDQTGEPASGKQRCLEQCCRRGEGARAGLLQITAQGEIEVPNLSHSPLHHVSLLQGFSGSDIRWVSRAALSQPDPSRTGFSCRVRGAAARATAL